MLCCRLLATVKINCLQKVEIHYRMALSNSNIYKVKVALLHWEEAF